MDFTFELASDLGYLKENFCVHYFYYSLLKHLSLGAVQGLKGRLCFSFSCSDTSVQMVLLPGPDLICVLGNFS